MNNLIYHLNLRKQLHLEALDALDVAITLAQDLEKCRKANKELELKLAEKEKNDEKNI